MLSVSNKSDTRILVISATSTDPTDASLVANAVAEATAEQMAYIMKSDEPTTVEKAEVESTPVSPSLKKIFSWEFWQVLYLHVVFWWWAT